MKQKLFFDLSTKEFQFLQIFFKFAKLRVSGCLLCLVFDCGNTPNDVFGFWFSSVSRRLTGVALLSSFSVDIAESFVDSKLFMHVTSQLCRLLPILQIIFGNRSSCYRPSLSRQPRKIFVLPEFPKSSSQPNEHSENLH